MVVSNCISEIFEARNILRVDEPTMKGIWATALHCIAARALALLWMIWLAFHSPSQHDLYDESFPRATTESWFASWKRGQLESKQSRLLQHWADRFWLRPATGKGGWSRRQENWDHSPAPNQAKLLFLHSSTVQSHVPIGARKVLKVSEFEGQVIICFFSDANNARTYLEALDSLLVVACLE